MKRALAVFFLARTIASASVPLGGVDVRTAKPTSVAPGKKTVVVFLSTKCPCSTSHEPELARLAKENTDFTFLGVHANADETASEAKEHFSKSPLGFAIVRDEGAKLADRFGAAKTPHAFVLNEAGEIVYRGGVDDSRHPERAKKPFLAQALVAVRAGIKPEVAEARPLGCTIER